MAREETKYRVHHQYGGVREVYDSRPVAISKSMLVRRVDELDKDLQGGFSPPFSLQHDIALLVILPYIYKIVHKLFSNNTSI